MALTEAYEICNLALSKIGHKQLITAALLTTPGTNNAAKLCSALYESERDQLMEIYPWRFAMKQLTYDMDNFEDTITGTTAASPVVVTGTDISVANIEADVGVYIYDTGVDDLDGETFMTKTILNETFDLYYPDGITKFGSTSIGTATSGYARLAPLSGDYAYAFKEPSDLLRFWKMLYNVKYEREGKYINTDSETIYFSYIAAITTVSLFSPAFIDCLATKLSAELAGSLADKPELKATQLKLLETVTLPRAFRVGAIEALPNDNQERRDPSYLTSWQKAGR